MKALLPSALARKCVWGKGWALLCGRCLCEFVCLCLCMSGKPGDSTPFFLEFFPPAGRPVMGGYSVWPLHTSPISWIFVQPELPAGRCFHSGCKPCLKRSHHSSEESPGGRSKHGVEMGAEDLKRWEVGACHIVLRIQGLRGQPSSSLLHECPRPGTPPWPQACQSKGAEVSGSALLQHFSERGLRSSSNSVCGAG